MQRWCESMVEKIRGKYSRTFKLSVGTTVVQLVSKDEKRACLIVYNNGSAAVYVLSAQNMAAADGIPVAAGGSYVNDTTTAALWIVAEAATQDVRVQVDGD